MAWLTSFGEYSYTRTGEGKKEMKKWVGPKEEIICEGGNGSGQRAWKTYPTSHLQSASMERGDFEEGKKK